MLVPSLLLISVNQDVSLQSRTVKLLLGKETGKVRSEKCGSVTGVGAGVKCLFSILSCVAWRDHI